MTQEQSFGSSLPGIQEILEALFFASDEPLSLKHVIDIFNMLEEGERPRRVNEEILLHAIEVLNNEYQETGRSFRIVKIAGGYQFATLPAFAPWLGKMVKEKARRKLTPAALESLAVIAYKQPVTKPELEAIRGVNADYVLKSLLERNLVTIVGRAGTPGRPLLYGTTREFLKRLGINDLSELPKPREFEELMAEAEFEVEKRLLAEQEEQDVEESSDPPPPRNPSMVVSEDGTLKEMPDGARSPDGDPPADNQT
jgi:segregation and condensation protein B